MVENNLCVYNARFPWGVSSWCDAKIFLDVMTYNLIGAPASPLGNFTKIELTFSVTTGSRLLLLLLILMMTIAEGVIIVEGLDHNGDGAFFIFQRIGAKPTY